jgi:hypothetical protein
MNMRNRDSICTLNIGLICPFTQVARGQQSGPVQPPPFGMIAERSESSDGGPSESDVATTNNPIAPHERWNSQPLYSHPKHDPNSANRKEES